MRLDYSRLDHVVLASPDEQARDDEIFRPIFGREQNASSRRNDVADAHHVSTCVRYALVGFVDAGSTHPPGWTAHERQASVCSTSSPLSRHSTGPARGRRPTSERERCSPVSARSPTRSGSPLRIRRNSQRTTSRAASRTRLASSRPLYPHVAYEGKGNGIMGD